MKGLRLMAVLLIVLGTLALVYRQFSYTSERHEAKFGPLELKVDEKETIAIPTWLGAGAIAVGVVLLLIRGKR